MKLTPVFLSLSAFCQVIKACSKAKILDDAMLLAGMGNMGFTTKSFCPTMATIAVDENINPDIVRKVGR